MRSHALLFVGLMFWLHPLHTTHTELVATGDGRVAVEVRAFTDDLRRAVARTEGGFDDSATARYVRGRVQLWDPRGRLLSLSWREQRVEGDITRLSLSADAPAGLSGSVIRQEMLTEMFDDQVNVLQARYAGRRVSLLFVTGDRGKPLP